MKSIDILKLQHQARDLAVAVDETAEVADEAAYGDTNYELRSASRQMTEVIVTLANAMHALNIEALADQE